MTEIFEMKILLADMRSLDKALGLEHGALKSSQTMAYHLGWRPHTGQKGFNAQSIWGNLETWQGLYKSFGHASTDEVVTSLLRPELDSGDPERIRAEILRNRPDDPERVLCVYLADMSPIVPRAHRLREGSGDILMIEDFETDHPRFMRLEAVYGLTAQESL